MSSAVAIPAGVEVTTTGLNLPANLGEDVWAAVGENLARSEQAMTWAIADWWAFGQSQSTYGRTTETAARFGWKASTLKTYAWVAKNVETSNRFPELPFSFHQEVASLPETEQLHYLEAASAEGWTHAELRRAVKGLPVETPTPQNSTETTASGPVSQYTVDQTLEETALAELSKAGLAYERALNAVRNPEFRLTVDVAQRLADAITEADESRDGLLDALADEVGGLLSLPPFTGSEV